jgi:FemAB-related protein (PEP-CTERM system-associated)
MSKELLSEPIGQSQGEVEIQCLNLTAADSVRSDLERFIVRQPGASMSHDPRWLGVLARGLNHVVFQLCARANGEIVGILPLALVKSVLFGRYLVSLPYLNGGGVLAESDSVANRLMDRAVELARQYNVRFLELRHESMCPHAAFSATRTDKLHMRLPLPATADALWARLRPKVRNQVRKGESQDFSLRWGGEELLSDFYQVFSQNMRDLGTPAFGRSLFREILAAFEADAEICALWLGNKPVAAALLVHSKGTTDVPSASSLRQYNSTNANMFMYWQLLCRAVQRSQSVFDFGRSSPGSGTYRFKEQWGAQPQPSVWQYHVLKGDINQMRPDNARFGRLIQIWRRLPLPLTRLIGPTIVRGIP